MPPLNPHPALSCVDPPAEAPDLVLEVPAVPTEVAGLRRAICGLAAEVGMGGERRSEIALAVGEACANVVIHAYAKGEPGTIRVTAACSREGLAVTVADDDSGMAPRADSPGLGLGLPLITSLASSVELGAGDGGGTEVRMCFASAPVAPFAQAG